MTTLITHFPTKPSRVKGRLATFSDDMRRYLAERRQATWENTLSLAKIKRRLHPYDLHHNFITAALEEGADIGAVAAIVGSSPETLRRQYQHVTNRLRRKTVALIKSLVEIET